MNIVIDINDFNKDNIYLQESVKNKIIDDSNFIKIIYSTKFFALNNLYISFNLQIIQIDQYFNKYKIIFNVKNNIKYINQLKLIEESILDKVIIDKRPVYKLHEYISLGNIKIFKDNLKINQYKHLDNELIIKISGIWENEYEYGLIYKFIDMSLI